MSINLILNPARPGKIEYLSNLQWDEGIRECRQFAWTWPVYCQLKNKLSNVKLSYEYDKDAINIVHGSVARNSHLFDGCKFFTIVIRADYPPFPYANLEIVQNQVTAGNRKCWIPHLPQPGLIRRNSKRATVTNVGYFGEEQNLGISKNELINCLSGINCKMIFRGIGDWHDMSDIDIIIGIRSLSKKTYTSKPPTKLFNAWIAGIPFIGGYDSAFSQVGIPGRNYIRISNMEEFLNAIKRLKKDQAFYRSIVEEGAKAIEPYTVEKTAERWITMLEKQAVPLFYEWKRRYSYEKIRSCIMTLVFEGDIRTRKFVGLTNKTL